MFMTERDCVNLSFFYTAFEHDIGTVPTDRLTLYFPETTYHMLDTFSSLSHAGTSAHIPCVLSHVAIHIMHDFSLLRYSLFSGRSRYLVFGFLTLLAIH